MNPGSAPKNRRNPGSLMESEPEFLLAGKLLKPHGLKGELWFKADTDFPDLFSKGCYVYVGKSYQKLLIHTIRSAGEKILISFEDITSKDTARQLTNQNVYLLKEQMPVLEDSVYHHHQLIGLSVINKKEEKYLGKIVEIIQTGANDIYVVKPDDLEKNETLIPAIEKYVLEINLETGVMVVNELDWYD